ncbi:accessory Sec system protein Asp3 [Lactobacillus crispatus]|uniref:Accessory Sec system protein Asp3 n=1 Tax=Lactobacillus crispatus TaxID=47770 RepID=A0A7H9E6K9_9LACO|nr:accessory Sec system protein Asp3 [Lactobacillus crispatus]QLL73246.1 accessory Sec system protein Asp3 [Lactobacillus crispatus]
MQKVINQIYWDSVMNSYMPGTSLTKYPNNYIEFVNDEMSAGVPIVQFDSKHNYQVVKEVPKLPILNNGQQYKIYINAMSAPEDSLIYRLTFYDVQGDEIERKVFSNSIKKFVYPKTANNYTLDIINGGCRALIFGNVQISDSDIDDRAYNDIYFDRLFQRTKTQIEDNLLIVADSKRSRKLQIDLKQKLVRAVPMTIVYVNWQYDGNLTQQLNQWINDHNIEGFRIFCTDKRVDKAAQKVSQTFPQVKIITTAQLLGQKYSDNQYHNYLDSDLWDPDWHQIIPAINKYFGK